MPLLSVIVFANNATEIQDILSQDLSRTEIILCTPKPVQYTGSLPPAIKFLVTAETEEGRMENEALRLVTGRYVAFRYPGEKWWSLFLTEVTEFLTQTPYPLRIHYLQGFYSTRNKLTHVFEVNPEVRRPFALHKMFFNARYFVPGLKMLYPTALIKAFKISFPEDVKSHRLRQAMFGVEAGAALYQASHYATFPIHRLTTTFAVPFQILKPNQKDRYTQKVIDKIPIFTKNPYTFLGVVANLFRLFIFLRTTKRRLQKHLLTFLRKKALLPRLFK